jgi:hypothetical protein
VVERPITPNGKLYGDPKTNTQYVALYADDLPDDFFEEFVPVTGITLSPLTVTSKVFPNTAVLAVPGWLNLNAAVAAPADATNKAITWSITSPATNWVSLDNGILTVIQGKTAPGSQTVTVTAAIPNGTAVGTAYTQNFTITLNYIAMTTQDEPATGISLTGPLSVYVGDSKSLLGQFAGFSPAAPKINGVALTVWDLDWEITGGTLGAAAITGSNISGNSAGSVSVRAKLPAAKNGAGGQIVSNTITVNVVNPPSSFTNVTGITCTPPTVQSKVRFGTDILVEAGMLSLAGAAVQPANATVQNITWTVKTGPQYVEAVELTNNKKLLVKKGELAGTSLSVTLTASVINGANNGNGTYSRDFVFPLAWVNAPIVANPVTSITITGGQLLLAVGESSDLRNRAQLNTADGQVPTNNERVITLDDLVFDYNGPLGTSRFIRLSETNNHIVTGWEDSTLYIPNYTVVQAKLPAAVNCGTEKTANISIKVSQTGTDRWSVTWELENAGSVTGRASDNIIGYATRWYGASCPYAASAPSGKTGVSWDTGVYGGITGLPNFQAEVAGERYTLQNLVPGRSTSRGALAVTPSNPYNSEQCMDIWVHDGADNIYGYLEGATNTMATNKVLHVHFPDVMNGPSHFQIKVNTNRESGSWGDVTIDRW